MICNNEFKVIFTQLKIYRYSYFKLISKHFLIIIVNFSNTAAPVYPLYAPIFWSTPVTSDENFPFMEQINPIFITFDTWHWTIIFANFGKEM